jgi:DNA polymerase-3 subunit alpha
MGIKILPPDINEGEAGFSVSNGSIRYGLTAIKSVGRPVIDAIVNERKEHGSYKSLKNFMERTQECGVNKRAIENFIKAGAFDSFGATRKQHMTVYSHMLDSITSSKRSVISGQLSLIDIVPEDEKDELEIRLPNVGEYDKAEILAFEKEVLGFYVSGHPLEEYQSFWEKHISARTSDFLIDEETKTTIVKDNSRVVIGGIITDKKIKYTKDNRIMAFMTLEDLVGSVEVIVFPQAYEKFSSKLTEDNKVFIEGRVALEDEQDGKLICEKITDFSEIPRNVWIKFPNMKAYTDNEQELFATIHDFDGIDKITIYIEETRQKKILPPNRNIKAEGTVLEKLGEIFGENNIKVI